jgi:hypothetical protein
MLLAAVLAFAVASVPLAGGRLSLLADLRLRRFRLLPLALGTQVVVLEALAGASPGRLGAAHVASYAWWAAGSSPTATCPACFSSALAGR